MTADDWPAVVAIYEEGLKTGVATFETEAPTWGEWDAARLPHSRLIARDAEGEIVGWAALSPVSKRARYAGVSEAGVYVAAAARGQGIGRLLLTSLIESAEQHGIWTIQAATIATNTASLALQERCGFRVIGRRERIGRRDGIWHDTILTEFRSTRIGLD